MCNSRRGICSKGVIGEYYSCLRKCKKCGKEKDLSFFRKNKECKYGYRYTCKQCHNDKNRKIPIAKNGYQFCRKCCVFKKLKEFEKCNGCISGYRYRCKECRNKSYIKRGKCESNPGWFKRGKQHLFFIDGKWKARAKIGKNKRFQRIRKKALMRDNYCCTCCGIKKNLHVHHIVPLREDISLAFDISNLITLCHKCHVDAEGLYKRK